MASDAVGASVETVRSLKGLKAQYHGLYPARRRERMPVLGGPDFRLDITPDHDVIGGLAAVLRFFSREDAFLDELAHIRGETQVVRVTFEVEYSKHFVSMSVGVRNVGSESWTFGSRAFARTEQIRRCRQDALREVSRCLAPS